MGNFIKKNWQKDATKVAVNTGIRAAGAISGAFLTNKLFGEGKSKTMQNIGGPVVLLVGTLGDMMLEDPKLRAACQGLATYGAMHSVAVIAPDSVGESVGISGLDVTKNQATATMFNGVGALGTTTTPPEFALAAGEKTVTDTDGRTYNNDWAYLAEHIDNADAITHTVSGVNDNTAAQQAAALMGVEDAVEAARLMGMF